jgi:hypothetical protein
VEGIFVKLTVEKSAFGSLWQIAHTEVIMDPACPFRLSDMAWSSISMHRLHPTILATHLRPHVRVVPACPGYSMLGFVAPNDGSKSGGSIFR